jgi:murein DD-endopeptidase MepM/ murein hydrolase activator NlpD
MRARLLAEAEWDFDARTYDRVPDGLSAAVGARVRSLAERVKRGQLRTAKPALAWPLWPVKVNSMFGNRIDPVDHHTWKRHDGIDLAGDSGQLVTAAGRGIVTEAGWKSGYGLEVGVQHPDGSMTRYGHLSQLLTHVGLEVPQGGPVGLVGATGHVTGPHLHFEVWRDGQACDPLDELGDPEPPDADETTSDSGTTSSSGSRVAATRAH